MIKRRTLESLAVVLFCLLFVSLVFNFVAFVRIIQLEEYRLEYGFLSEAYQRLQESYDELKETYLPRPPISKSEAVDLALKYGGWNETALKGMEVTASLDYVMFRRGPTFTEFAFLHEVDAHVSDYSSKETCHDGDCTTFRYVWTVAVLKVEETPVKTITTHGLYHVDASTGEAILSEDLLQSTGTMLYISAEPDSLSIKETTFHYAVVLINPNDAPVSVYVPHVTVSLSEARAGGVEICAYDILLSMHVTLSPHEERTAYEGVIAFTEDAEKGTYWLQAIGPPIEKVVFHTLPTLITLASL